MPNKTLTDPDHGDAKLDIHMWAPGRVTLVARDGVRRAHVGPFDAVDLIAAIREVVGPLTADQIALTDAAAKSAARIARDVFTEAARAYAKSPTAEDFAKAEFARQEDGRIAARLRRNRPLAWCTQGFGTFAWRTDAEMAAEGGWSIVTPAPSTSREALALAADLAYEVEGDTMPDQPGYMMVWEEGGMVNAYSHSNPRGLTARGTDYRLLLIDPPASKRPEWADADWVWANTSTGARVIWEHLTGDLGIEWWACGDRALSLNEMAERRPVPVVPEGVES